MSNLTGKRLLILGANPETIPIIEIAKKMGVYTIVTDYNPDAPAKKYADKSFDVDGMDIEGLVRLGETEHVDGIMVGVADTLVSPYQQVCSRLNKPCYLTEEMVKTFNNKENFKKNCEKFGIHGVPDYKVSPVPTDEEIQNIQFPVIVKPVDSCSGKGITLCHNRRDLEKGIKKALDFSKRKRYLVEQYMIDNDVSIYYTIKEGEYYLSSLSDRYTNRDQGELCPVCVGDIFPSHLLNEFMNGTHQNFCKMFQAYGIKDGVMFIQAFYKDGKFCVYDPGFRLQGGGYHIILNAVNGFDHRKMLIHYALTGSMGEEDLREMNDPMMRGKAVAVIWFLLDEGTIASIEGMEFIKNHPSIVYVIKRFTCGDIITKEMTGTEQQVFLRLFVVCKNKEELKRLIKELNSRISVKDQNGKEMVLKSLDKKYVDM